MTEYHSSNVRLLDFQLDKLKSMAKNATDVTLRLSYNMIGTDETNVLQKLLLTARQVLNIFKAFANNLLKDIKL